MELSSTAFLLAANTAATTAIAMFGLHRSCVFFLTTRKLRMTYQKE